MGKFKSSWRTGAVWSSRIRALFLADVQHGNTYLITVEAQLASVRE